MEGLSARNSRAGEETDPGPPFDSEQPSRLDFTPASRLFWKELLLSMIYHAALRGTRTFHRDNH